MNGFEQFICSLPARPLLSCFAPADQKQALLYSGSQAVSAPAVSLSAETQEKLSDLLGLTNFWYLESRQGSEAHPTDTAPEPSPLLPPAPWEARAQYPYHVPEGEPVQPPPAPGRGRGQARGPVRQADPGQRRRSINFSKQKNMMRECGYTWRKIFFHLGSKTTS